MMDLVMQGMELMSNALMSMEAEAECACLHPAVFFASAAMPAVVVGMVLGRNLSDRFMRRAHRNACAARDREFGRTRKLKDLLHLYRGKYGSGIEND